MGIGFMSLLPERSQIRSQLVRLTPTLLWIYIPTWFLLNGVVIFCLNENQDIGDFFRDSMNVVQMYGNVRFYYGAMTNLGALLWCTAAIACLFTYALACRQEKQMSTPFFLWSGLLSLLLLFDDLFLLHETVFSDDIGIAEETVLAIYVVISLLYLFRWHRFIILQTDFLLLLFALGCFTLSLLQDVFYIFPRNFLYPGSHTLFEDGPKFVGIVSWCAYLTRASLQYVSSMLGDRSEPALKEDD